MKNFLRDVLRAELAAIILMLKSYRRPQRPESLAARVTRFIAMDRAMDRTQRQR